MNKPSSSKKAVWVLCALIMLTSAVVASAAPAVSVKAQTSIQQIPIITDTWAVQVSPGTDPNQLALQMGAQNLGQIGSLTDYYLFRIPGSNAQATAMADVFASNSKIMWFQQQVARQLSTRAITDPLYPNQWHLNNTSGGVDIDVVPAWNADHTGAGVTIGIVDDGLQRTHPDLSAQYNSAGSWDFNGNDADPSPVKLTGLITDRHGTAVAGLAAANNDGASCGVGVAYDAGLSGIRLISDPVTDAQQAAALTYAPTINFIYNNSWGPADDMTEPLVGPGQLTLAALQNGVSGGRSGKGSIYVWSAGNGLKSLDNVNYDGYANSRFAIAVGAVDNTGVQATYSEPGAAMLVTAPSNSPPLGFAITTTDLAGVNGYNTAAGTAGDCTSAFGGTSSSAPIVSGVVALMLQTNPNLGWRDVQNILARTAVKNDSFDADWFTNSAGLHVNHKYGFGLVDANAAVAMANPGSYTNLLPAVSVSPGVVNVNQEVPDNDLVTGVTSTSVVSQDITLEHVEVVFNASAKPLEPTGGYRGDLKLVLTSPSGTQSVLSEAHSDAGSNYTNWKFMTVRDWGESSLGTWTLKVTDEKGAGVSIFNSWQLILQGVGAPGTYADVHVSVNGTLMGSYGLLDSTYNLVSYPGVMGGPLYVDSTTGKSIVTSIRLLYNNKTLSELMGVPTSQLLDDYSMPMYVDNGTNMDSQIRFTNTSSTTSTTVKVYLGGTLMGTYPLGPSSATRVRFAGVTGGPVRIVGTPGVPILAGMRIIYGGNSSFDEMMAYPATQLASEYWFPFYTHNNTNLKSDLRIANTSSTQSSIVNVYFGGALKGTYTLLPNTSRIVSYPGVIGGPVRVAGSVGVPIIASMGLLYNNKTYSELMGVPTSQLLDDYSMPVFLDNNGSMDSQIRFTNTSSTTSTTVQVFLGGTLMGTYPLGPSSATRVRFAGVSSGPIRIVGTPGVPILAGMRIIYGGNSSFDEIMAYPTIQLESKYWFPYYSHNQVNLDTEVRMAVP